ncbi:MAG TPA: hypothetical protein VFQ35_05150 [Polyangiaceae bacterium]|nr:hypothetical protein [Polyangiaceae bacterium]
MRERSAGGLLGAALLLAALSARADTEQLGVKLNCEPALSVGRIRCALDVSSPEGSRLAWVDALVVETPPFARALRTRVAQPIGVDRTKSELLLGLVASGEGVGTLGVRARAVVCPISGKARCRPLSRLVTLELKVGASPPPPP